MSQSRFEELVGEIARAIAERPLDNGLADHLNEAWPFGGKDPRTGKFTKGAVKGRTAMRFFRLMNRMRFLRGTLFDPFRNTDEARLARRLLAEYEADIDFALMQATPDNAERIAELLNLPDRIRGYGHVRARHAEAVAPRRQALRDAILAGQTRAA